MTWISENIMSIIAVTISIVAFITVRRGISSRARADALDAVKGEIQELNIRLGAEVKKLQDGLDRCIKERVVFKEEITTLKKALKLSNIEVEELRENIETDPGPNETQ